MDYGIERSKSENKIKKNFYNLLEAIIFARDNDISFIAVKITTLASVKLLEKISNTSDDYDDLEEYKKLITRINTLCKIASDGQVKILIDAEESSIQNAIDTLAFRMMANYNKNKVYIYNTIQFYRKDRIDFFYSQIALCRKNQIQYGVKIVRGAYIEKENALAFKKKCSSLLHNCKEDTDRDFNKAIDICFNNLDMLDFMVATHNLQSIEYCVNKMKDKKMVQKSNKIYFAQLLGMSDSITFNLSEFKYHVLKYVPYGSIKDLFPYLTRRINENSAIKNQIIDEIKIISEVLKIKK